MLNLRNLLLLGIFGFGAFYGTRFYDVLANKQSQITTVANKIADERVMLASGLSHSSPYFDRDGLIEELLPLDYEGNAYNVYVGSDAVYMTTKRTFWMPLAIETRSTYQTAQVRLNVATLNSSL